MDTNDLRQIFSDSYGPFFTYEEFACRCDVCARDRRNDTDEGEWFDTPEFRAFMDLLIMLRKRCGFPFVINSGYRCPTYNDSLYKADGTHLDGPHTKGAADIGVAFERAYRLTQNAFDMDLGIGTMQHGPVSGRYVHLDNLGPRVWTYP